MIEIKPYFQQPEHLPGNTVCNTGMRIARAWENGFQLNGKKIALVGVPDTRNVRGIEKATPETTHKIRQQLSQLASCHSSLVIDLGDMVEGKTVRDTFFALAQVVQYLLGQEIIPVLMGCSDSFIYGIYNAIHNTNSIVRHVHIDYRFDNQIEEFDIVTNENYFERVLAHFPKNITEISLMGYQTYYEPSEPFSIKGEIPITNYRLGWVRDNLLETEAILRNAGLVTIDMNSVRISDNPANALGMPNGLYAEEMCQLAWYAGYADKLTVFGIFNYFAPFDNRDAGARLTAQLLWHFLEGYAQRQGETPNDGSEKFVQLHVNLDSIGQKLIFLKSNKTGRFWLKVSPGKEPLKEKMLPVSKQEYYNAVNNQVSEKILFYLTQI
jgi:arginase family enzyme